MGKAHSNAYSQVEHFYDCPYRVRRRLLCGRDAASLAAMADRWGWEETTTDWRSVIERADIDAVDVSLPNYLHAEVVDCRGAGRQDGALREAVGAVACRGDTRWPTRRARVPTLVWFNYRRVPAIAYARQLIDQGRLGTIYHYDAAYRQQWGPDTSRAGTWKMDRAQAGSGVADDLLTHLLDTAMYLNGPVQEGSPRRAPSCPIAPIDDAFLAMLKFENGSVGHVRGDALRRSAARTPTAFRCTGRAACCASIWSGSTISSSSTRQRHRSSRARATCWSPT